MDHKMRWPDHAATPRDSFSRKTTNFLPASPAIMSRLSDKMIFQPALPMSFLFNLKSPRRNEKTDRTSFPPSKSPPSIAHPTPIASKRKRQDHNITQRERNLRVHDRV
ncbi:hypothetical protein BJY00DRAFT_58959 [Aspergillus carlsbadensis]|nr:hypothetical protein BJY00DRAFT_58959 [Aspergillus carlsbadensis]